MTEKIRANIKQIKRLQRMSGSFSLENFINQKKINNMTAEQAREITLKNQFSNNDFILKTIQGQAELGNSSYHIRLNESQIEFFIELGYSVKYSELVGEHKITW